MIRKIMSLIVFVLIPANSYSSESLSVGRESMPAINAMISLIGLEEEVREPKDWAVRDQSSNINLSDHCSMLSEIKPIASNRANAVFLLLKNKAKNKILIRPEKITLKFGKRQNIRPRVEWINQPVSIESDQYFTSVLVFPNKDDVKDETSIGVSIPVFRSSQDEQPECTIQSSIHRSELLKDDPFTLYSYAKTQFSIASGVSLLRLGSLGDLASGGLSVGLDLTRFHRPESGYWLLIQLDDAGSFNQKAIANAFRYTGTVSLFSGTFAVGMTFRKLLSEQASLQWSAGPALFFMEVNEPTSIGLLARGSTLGIVSKFGYQYRIARMNQINVSATDWNVGVNAILHAVIGGSIRSIPFSGLGLGAQAFLSIGF